MIECKSPSLDFSLYKYPSCDFEKIVPHTYKSRFCNSCGIKYAKENIPTEIVEMLDNADQFNFDTSVSPRFDCEYCSGKMVPIYYISVKGKIYQFKN